MIKGFATILPLLLTAASLAQPANDGVCGAIALANRDCYPRVAANWTAASNAGATNEALANNCWAFNQGRTVWYSFVATSTAQLVTTDWYYGPGGTVDNQLQIFRSSNNLCSGVLTRIGCNEDITGGAGVIAGNNDAYVPNDYFNHLTVTGLTIGNTYFIRLDGYRGAGNAGFYVICTEPAPANDACATAQSVVINTVYPTNNTGSSAYSNSNVPDKAFTCGSVENMIFYTFTAPATDVFYINQWFQVCDYGLGTQFIVYNAGWNCASIPSGLAGPNAASELLCSLGTPLDRNLAVNLVSGQIYYIVIDGVAGDECTFNWSITQNAPLPVELLYFNCVDGTLVWKSSYEQNIQNYTIERSYDGSEYAALDQLEALGANNSYYYGPLDQDGYYKLSNVTYDGQKAELRTVYCKGITESQKYGKLFGVLGQFLGNYPEIKESLQPGVYILLMNNNKTIKITI